MAMDSEFCKTYAANFDEVPQAMKEDIHKRIYILAVFAEVVSKPRFPEKDCMEGYVPSEKHRKRMAEMLKDPNAYLEKWKKEHKKTKPDGTS